MLKIEAKYAPNRVGVMNVLAVRVRPSTSPSWTALSAMESVSCATETKRVRE